MTPISRKGNIVCIGERIKSHLLSCGSVHIHLFDVSILGSLKFFKQDASTIVTLLAATGLVSLLV